MSANANAKDEAQNKIEAHYINGEFLRADEHTIDTVNPATEKILASLPTASDATVRQAVAAAEQSFENGLWRRMSPEERGTYLMEISEAIEDNAELLARLETQDTGLPLWLTRGGHIPRAAEHFRYFAELSRNPHGDFYKTANSFYQIVGYEPRGVAAILVPWNAPLAVGTIHLAAALATGNSCVLKPSEKAPLSATRLAQIIAQLGLPSGVVNIIYGPGETTGQDLTKNKGVDTISFTGGKEAARDVIMRSSRNLTKVNCELGGKSASIVFGDCDWDATLDGVLISSFGSNGEACMSGSRVLVANAVFDRFVADFVARVRNIRVGDPLAPFTEIGPMISGEHKKKVQSLIQRAIESGAELVCGGHLAAMPPKGFFVAPTVLTSVQNSMEICQNEVFGPVVTIQAFSEQEEAIWIANESSYGLAAYIWTSNTTRALQCASALHVGCVYINSGPVRDLRVPFGGFKDSGLGRVGGRHSLEFFADPKVISLPCAPATLPRIGLTT